MLQKGCGDNSYLNKHNIIFDVSINLDSDVIISNRNHLIRIIFNLVSNAIKFCDRKNNEGRAVVSIDKGKKRSSRI